VTVTPEPSAPPAAVTSLPLRLLQFIFAVGLGISTGIVANIFGCLAHQYRRGNLYVDPPSIPLFVLCVSVFACILIASLMGLDALIKFNRQKFTYVAAIVLAAVISGYFFYFPCG
jgi:hypothetical protein